MAAHRIGFGYNPFDNSNGFMEKWYKAATVVDPRVAADPAQLRQLTGSPVPNRVIDPIVAPQEGRLYYGNYQGLPNEWFYDFAKRKKFEFEEHVRAIGYEINLADTPGLGKVSELPNTPDYLEALIPPAYNPDAFIREHYFEYMFANAGHGSTQNGLPLLPQGSPADTTDDTESEFGEMVPEPVVDVDPVKKRTPVNPAVLHDNPLIEEDSPVLQPVDADDKNSIDNLSFEKDIDDDANASATNLNDFVVNAPNLLTVGQEQATIIRDNSAVHHYELVNAGVDLTTCNIIDNHVAAQDTGLGGSLLIIDEEGKLEKDQASNNFFGGAPVEESSSPHNQPMVGQQSGFVDIREGLENILQQSSHPQENLRSSDFGSNDPQAGLYNVIEEQHIDMTRDSNIPEHRVILKPASQKAKTKARQVRSQTFPELEGEILSFIDHRQRKNRAKPPSSIVTHNLSTEEEYLKVAKAKLAANKRVADNTFSTRSATIRDADPTKVRGSKKVRSNENEPQPISAKALDAVDAFRNRHDDTQNYPNFTRAPNGVNEVDLIINGDHGLPQIGKDEAARRRANAQKHGVLDLSELPSFSPFDVNSYCSPTISPITPERLLAPLPAPLTPYPPAYPGQFKAISLYDLYTLARQQMTIRNAPRNPLTLTFGDRLHPNPLITHPAIPEHPSTLPIGALNYTHHTLPPSHHLHARLDNLSKAVDLSASAPVALHRSPSQETLRTEAHRELAAARLEGFPVGEYRYYQGHLSVEEYIERGMCICWSACGCSGWCSRFGDLICPCSEVLELGNDDDLDDDDDDADDDETEVEDGNEENGSEEGGLRRFIELKRRGKQAAAKRRKVVHGAS